MAGENTDSSALATKEKPWPPAVADFLKVQKKSFRNLVQVAPIDKITPCSWSKKLVVAHVKGWQVMVAAGKFDVEELVIFLEPDCFVPEGVARADAFKSKGYSMSTHQGKRGYHIKTVRHREVISQGLILALHEIRPIEKIKVALYEHFGKDAYDSVVKEFGTYHFADFIGATPWEVPQLENNCMLKLGNRPAFVPRAEFNRIQNCPNLFKKAKYKSLHWQETVKLDGTSMSVYFIVKSDERNYRALNRIPEGGPPSSNAVHENGRFGICSREVDLGEHPNNLYWQVALQHGLPAKMAAVNKSFVVQGELVGSSVNGNREDYPKGKHEFIIYDVWDIPISDFRPPDQVVGIAEELGLRHVPVINHSATIPQMAKNYDDFYQRARLTEREGLVYKCIEERLSFKVANPDWLVKYGL